MFSYMSVYVCDVIDCDIQQQQQHLGAGHGASVCLFVIVWDYPGQDLPIFCCCSGHGADIEEGSLKE